MPVSTCRPRA